MNIVSDIISSAVSKLTSITEKSPVDWKVFDEALASLEDINVFNEQYEETILSEYITDGIIQSGKEDCRRDDVCILFVYIVYGVC